MAKQFKAVFENGVLRPLAPIQLPEHSQVVLNLSEPVETADIESLVDQEYLERFGHELENVDVPSLEEVRQILSKVHGTLVSDFIAERDER
jgi:predicted DNA-binding antitoxin AbrB/MazE fold protein